MDKHKNLIKHDPDNGQYGDCVRTAIACLLSLRPEQVPHFFSDGDNPKWDVDVIEFLSPFNLSYFMFPLKLGEDQDHNLILDVMRVNNPDTLYLLYGTSKTGCNHNVICKAGEIIHDPTQGDPGIVGPCDDGLYWIGLIIPAHPTTTRKQAEFIEAYDRWAVIDTVKCAGDEHNAFVAMVEARDELEEASSK